jgi:LPXTG-motif cell wall-anchored protein
VRAPSRLQALIVTASLAGAVAGMPAAALAQSAGDEQYQDPLAGSTSTGTTKTTPSVPNPSTVPQLSPGAATPSTQTTTPATPSAPAASPSAAPSAASPSALPNTGIDGRVLAVLGLGMLLCGIGLRLRTARERF